MTNTLHIYGQGLWHDEAIIVGDEEALRKLRDAIDEALRDAYGCAETFAADGEGYKVLVANVVADKLDAVILPYGLEIALDLRPEAKPAESLFQPAHFR